MRISIFTAVLSGIILLTAVAALAFYPSGEINEDISYSNIEIIKRGHSLRVAGILTNKTSESIRVNGGIKFCTIHKTVLNSARISATIPPNGNVPFDRPLVKSNYKEIKHAYRLEWDIRNYRRTTRPRPSMPTVTKRRKSIGYANTRSSDANVHVSGSGSHNSDQFKLKTGLYIAKVSHTGDRYCGIKLLHGDGRMADIIAMDAGYLEKSKAVRINEDGYYLLDISAHGDWTVSMQFQAPRTPQQDGSPGPAAAGESSSSGERTDPVLIKLKNGRTMKAASCWEEGDKLMISIYGGVMSIDQSEVLEIVKPN